MKKTVLFLAALALSAFSLFAAEDRSHVLKIYNWADYIDESVLEEFPEWYKQQTGEEVEIIYQLFDINEVMLSKIERGHEDFDVVCPSEYIIERMLRNDLLLPIDKDFGDTPNNLGNISPYIIERFNKIDGAGKNANDYAVGYMWGTTGLMYNPKFITREEASSWSLLTNPKISGKLFMKDAFRDVYSPLLIFLKQDELKAGTVTMDELMYDTSEESIALVENYLKSFKESVAGWEADFGKEFMTKEKGWVNYTWSGDAQWAIDEGALVGVTLDYVVPAEGSNVWFDGWVIPRYAKNVKAARYFINYLCSSENAIRNMDAIGYVSAIGTPDVLANRIDSVAYPEVSDLSYFFGPEASAVHINPVQYPDITVVNRCAMMHDTGDRTELLLAMWSRVKGDNANTLTFVIIIGAVAAAIIVAIVSRNSKKHRHHSRRR